MTTDRDTPFRCWPYEPVDPAAALAQPESACTLPSDELERRSAELRASFRPGILEIEELPDGYVYWFERSEGWLAKVTEFALFESRCCAFLDYGVGLVAGGERISLRITGKPGSGGKQFLSQSIRETARSSRAS